MAKIFGERSRYLILNDYVFQVLSWIVLGWLLYLIYWYWDVVVFHNTGTSVSLLTVFFLLVFFWTRKKGEEQIDISSRFKQGRHGEYEVCDELMKLPGDFLIFQDVKIPGRRDNIDFVVLGPTGVFALEVKSHKGKIGFNGTRLTRDGSRIIGKSFLRQAMDEAMRLHEHLMNVAGKEFFISPTLVFSSDYASVRFGFKKQGGVYVIGKRYLHELVMGEKNNLEQGDIDLLKAELMKLVRIIDKK